MSTLPKRIGVGSARAIARTARAARDPLKPVRAIRDIYRPEDPDTPEVFEEMTLQEHLVELRDRIMKIVIALVLAMIVGFYFAGGILENIKDKANAEQGLDVKSPTDPLTLTFKVAFYVAIAIIMPIIIYQLVGFLSPGLTRREKRVLFSALPFVSLLFIGGAAYGYFVAAPRALYFLSTWNLGAFTWQPDGPEVITFFLTLMIGLGLAFQLPVIMFILAKIGIVTARKMRQWRRYAYLVLCIAAAVITPSTDPFNMAIVAVPLIVLYEFGLIITTLFAKTSLRDKLPDAADAASPTGGA
ncbi:MAG TPA: twin-arginine translocase subunit TatC [Thermomicrobiales bacterium]|nr:twin-arginine translocase subunit TatC [Thermomicrobiales bacterium]